MGGSEAGTPVSAEPMLGYHPCGIGFLTCSHNLAGGQCQAGEFDWGGPPPKEYRRRSKVPSEWSETIRRVQRHKGA